MDLYVWAVCETIHIQFRGSHKPILYPQFVNIAKKKCGREIRRHWHKSTKATKLSVKIATARRRKFSSKYKVNMPLNGDTINADKLSGIDEESDIYEGFSPHVDRSQIVLPDPSPTSGKVAHCFLCVCVFVLIFFIFLESRGSHGCCCHNFHPIQLVALGVPYPKFCLLCAVRPWAMANTIAVIDYLLCIFRRIIPNCWKLMFVIPLLLLFLLFALFDCVVIGLLGIYFSSIQNATEKKPPLKTFDDVQTLLSQGKKREVKLLIRENAWPINSTIRAQLWPAICSQHQVGKSMLEGYYWDMVNQVIIELILTSTRIIITWWFCMCAIVKEWERERGTDNRAQKNTR